MAIVSYVANIQRLASIEDSRGHREQKTGEAVPVDFSGVRREQGSLPSGNAGLLLRALDNLTPSMTTSKPATKGLKVQQLSIVAALKSMLGWCGPTRVWSVMPCKHHLTLVRQWKQPGTNGS